MNFPIPFTKMSGTGNDFIIIDHRQPFLADDEIAGFAAKVCKRMFSVGADGLILIEEHPEADFQWQFFNGDGSRAEMCGNGARCAARYAHSKGIAPARMSFMTVAGLIRAEVIDDQVKLEMTPPMATEPKVTLTFGGQERTLAFSNTGVPHAVYFVDDNGTTPVKEWGREVRMHHHFQPAGTNVNFAQVTGPSALRVRTYERGVEDETMACGTGAVAAALLGGLLGHVRSPVTVESSGGEILTIFFDIEDREQNLVKNVFLEGPASFIYEGQLHAEALR
ncbi:MAG: diaminopimelate epimerase [Desulfobulbaceae bacterium]|nr:MAG: diaminopimelate epimerase [Desulfobulbaceae bacterium]